MSWGDGAPLARQSLNFSHIYNPGTYSAHLLIIDSGAVHSYSMTVTVSALPGASVGVNVAFYPPVNLPNPGLTPARPVPDFVVVQTTSVSRLPNGQAVAAFLGMPGEVYTIEATSDLGGGFVPVGTMTAGVDGKFQYVDPAAVGSPKRFYRATYP
jgi:hypothetical protein